MQFTDDLGLAYSASAETSVQRFNQVINGYLEYANDTMDQLGELLKSDNDIPMAHCFRGYLLKMASDPRFNAPLQGCLDTMKAIEANEREQMHAAALTHWLTDDLVATTRALEAILAKYPRDMLALRAAHNLHFYSGDAAAMQSSVARALPAWPTDHPWYGSVLGMHSFGLEEAGHYEEAEAVGRQAVELNQQDLWAAHAVGHVLQMQSRFDEGVAWVDSLTTNWQAKNNFENHIHWHKALFCLGQGDTATPLEIYDVALADAHAADFYLDVCNSASLLWRLELLGIDTGDRWEQLKDFSARRVNDQELVFVTLHYLIMPALKGDQQAIEHGLMNFKTWSDMPTTQGEIARHIGQPMAEGIAAIGAGQLQQGVDSLKSVQDDMYKIGGSHAQRHLFNQVIQYYEEALA